MLTEENCSAFAPGESDAVRAVYREYGRLVFAVCRNQLGSPQLAEEAAQQTFLKAWRSAATVEPGRDLAPWLATIARRTASTSTGRSLGRRRRQSTTCRSRIRRWCRRRCAIERPTTSGRSGRPWTSCPRTNGQIVQLQHLEGMTQTAVAQRLNLPVGTVKSRSYRAHKKLAARLGHLREGFD